MNCPIDENVCSVKKENHLGYYRLHTVWRSNGFFINITSKDGAWRGEMTENNIKEMSNQLEISPETYIQECKEALTCHDGKPGMVYMVENGVFTWKEVVDEDSGIKIKMGSVMLQPASFIDTIQNLVDVALNCNKKLQNVVSDLVQKEEKQRANRNELVNKLDELLKAKQKMEYTLYKKFLLLLNAKKKKILELENALENNSKRPNPETTQNSEDAYNIETEDEEDVIKKEISPRKRKPELKQSLSISQGEASEQKKAKNIEVAVKNITLEGPEVAELDSSEPGPSTMAKSINLDIPSTKDEILDYFFCGNS